MVRRTKEEAQATRSHILDTAELVFEQHGVSGASLHAIAKAAGLTRGAIYWHFRDKADLFNAMMERATLPLEQAGRRHRSEGAAPTLVRMREGFIDVLRRIAADAQMRRVFGIATHKVEYVGEMQAVRQRHLAVRDTCLVDVERRLNLAMRRGELSRRLPARAAAVGLHALFDGLLHNWMLDPGAFKLVTVGTQVLDAYLAGLAAAPAAETISVPAATPAPRLSGVRRVVGAPAAHVSAAPLR
ncbi:MAG: TetR family transcriptional regulator [Burkholderiaceae bacterium]